VGSAFLAKEVPDSFHHFQIDILPARKIGEQAGRPFQVARFRVAGAVDPEQDMLYPVRPITSLLLRHWLLRRL
jgi:hypothetical protein